MCCRYRERQLQLQLPKQDLSSKYCSHLEPVHQVQYSTVQYSTVQYSTEHRCYVYRPLQATCRIPSDNRELIYVDSLFTLNLNELPYTLLRPVLHIYYLLLTTTVSRSATTHLSRPVTTWRWTWATCSTRARCGPPAPRPPVTKLYLPAGEPNIFE